MLVKKSFSLAIEAAVLAGRVIMDVYDTAFDVVMKADNSPLTLADQKANDIIMSFLEKTEIRFGELYIFQF